MNLRNTALLFGLSLGMLWLFGLMVASKRTTFDESLLLPTFQAETHIALESISIKRKDKDKEKSSFDLELVKTETGWSLKSGKNTVRVNDGQVGKMIKELKDAAKIDDSDASPDPATNGLANPQLTVTIKAKTGKDKDEPKEWQLSVGKPTADETRYFVGSSDRPGRVMVVAANSLDSLFPPALKDENSLRPQQLFEFNEPSVKKLILKQDKTELELKKADDGSWRILKPPMGPAEYEGPALPKDPLALPKKETPTGGVKALIFKILALKVDSENDFISPSADINSPDYGLEPGKESLRIEVDTGGDGKKAEALLVGNKVPDKDFYFAHMQNDPGIFMIGSRQLESLRDYLKKPGELRSTNIIFVDVKKVDMVKLTIGKEQIVLTHPEEKPWQMQLGDAKPARANDPAVEDIFKALDGKREIQKFYDVEGDEAKKLDAELVLDGSLGEVALFTDSQPKKTKEEKGDEKKDEKKDTKAAVTLIFGKADKDGVPVKRVQQDGTVSRFSLSKASAEKIVPPDPRLAFLDAALPPVSYEDIDSLILDRGGKEKLEFIRGTGANAGRWLLKSGTEPILADNGKVDAFVRFLANMRALKWLKKIDDKKPDLAQYGLEPPVVTATLVIRKTTPALAVTMTGLLAGVWPLESAAFWLAAHESGKPETVSIRFGKETEDEKDKPGSFTLYGGNDLLFLSSPELVKALKTEDFRDRSKLLTGQQILDASALSAGPAALLLSGPIVTATVNTFDPTKIKELRLDVHQYDLRKFRFVRQAPEKAKEKDKSEKPGVRGQVWQDQSGLIDFTLDSEKVNALAEEFAKFKAERLVTLTDGPKPDFKLDAKDAILKIEATLESGQVVTLTVGARFLHHGYFAQSSAWPGAVFLIAPEWVDTYLRGTAYFGKDRVARE